MDGPQQLFPCPCCGYLVFHEPPGGDGICPICFWQDDNVQLRWPDFAGGPNRPSLVEAQKNYSCFGAAEKRTIHLVRPPEPEEVRDEGWEPADLRRYYFEREGELRAPWPTDRTTLYWWRPTFWRRPQR
ncbi:hypothetical protein KSE96_31040 (plasmid) [Rhodococcus qingshengii]|nr:hypothetical protein KSE96_31040 [Rhodococcus qingshengii]